MTKINYTCIISLEVIYLSCFEKIYTLWKILSIQAQTRISIHNFRKCFNEISYHNASMSWRLFTVENCLLRLRWTDRGLDGLPASMRSSHETKQNCDWMELRHHYTVVPTQLSNGSGRETPFGNQSFIEDERNSSGGTNRDLPKLHKMNVKENLKDFSYRTTFHGLRYISEEGSVVRRWVFSF